MIHTVSLILQLVCIVSCNRRTEKKLLTKALNSHRLQPSEQECTLTVKRMIKNLDKEMDRGIIQNKYKKKL